MCASRDAGLTGLQILTVLRPPANAVGGCDDGVGVGCAATAAGASCMRKTIRLHPADVARASVRRTGIATLIKQIDRSWSRLLEPAAG